MNEKLLEYSDLIVRVGVNLQKGQTLVISCPVNCAYFAKMLAEKAYDAGAREVVVRWHDDDLARMKYLRADDAVFDETPRWTIDFYNDYAGIGAALINVSASDPENLKGVSPDRIQRASRSASTQLKDFYGKMMANDFPWCIASVPSEKWARKVFPGLGTDESMDKLWDAIFTATRVNGNAVGEWRAKVKRADELSGKLNSLDFAKLHYKNSLGTDLWVELPEMHKWSGGGEKTKSGVTFVANMPTEEIFTLPKRGGVNGVLYSSMPLSLNGNMVRDIKFTFENGKIIEAEAKEGLEYLLKELDMDEGARYLGEIALVPYHSPISEMKIIFYNTLFDENASCHFAFGKAYPVFKDVDERSEEELKARGMNDSLTHVDFMVGTADLSITGMTRDGKEIPVFVNGDFAL